MSPCMVSNKSIPDECRECGRDIEPDHPACGDPTDPTCPACRREDLREDLDPTTDSTLSRERALRVLDRLDLLPVIDPIDDGRITDVEVEHGSGYGGEPAGYWIKRLTKRLARDCPNCGYDRARYRYRNYVAEMGESTVCVVCGFVHEENSTF